MYNAVTQKVAELLLETDSRTLTPLKVVKLEQGLVRPCYDSEWFVTTETGKTITIIRDYSETYEEVERVISQVPFEEILARAVRAKIYYD